MSQERSSRLPILAGPLPLTRGVHYIKRSLLGVMLYVGKLNSNKKREREREISVRRKRAVLQELTFWHLPPPHSLPPELVVMEYVREEQEGFSQDPHMLGMSPDRVFLRFDLYGLGPSPAPPLQPFWFPRALTSAPQLRGYQSRTRLCIGTPMSACLSASSPPAPHQKCCTGLRE